MGFELGFRANPLRNTIFLPRRLIRSLDGLVDKKKFSRQINCPFYSYKSVNLVISPRECSFNSEKNTNKILLVDFIVYFKCFS